MDVAVDMSDAPAAFGLPAMMREMDMDLSRVPMDAARAADYVQLKAFATDPSAPFPGSGSNDLYATADYLCASDALIRRLTASQYLVESENDAAGH